MSYRPKTSILNSFFRIALHGIASIHSFIQSFSNIYGTPPTSGPVLPAGKTLVIKSGVICMALKWEMWILCLLFYNRSCNTFRKLSQMWSELCGIWGNTFLSNEPPPLFFCPLFFERWCAEQNFSDLRCHLQTGLLRFRASQVELVVKNSSANAGDTRDTGSIPGSGRSIPWRREQQPTLVFLPIESRGQRSLVGYSRQTCKELDTAKAT